MNTETQPEDQGQLGSTAFPEPSQEAIHDARAEAVVDAIKESTKDAYKRGANEGYGDEPTNGPKFSGSKDVFNLQDLVDLHPDQLADRLKGDALNPLTEAQVAGLIEIERSGKNRDDVVKALCARLGIKSPYEVTNAGPAFTNVVNRI